MSGALALSNDSKQDWETPQWVINAAEHVIGGQFDLDAAARVDNTKAARFIGPPGGVYKSAGSAWAGEDALSGAEWPQAKRVWCNPPYADPAPWIAKASEQVEIGAVKRIVMLLPAKTDTLWFHEMVNQQLATQVLLLSPRISFVGSAGSPAFGSLFVLFGFRWYKPGERNIAVYDIRAWRNKDNNR